MRREYNIMAHDDGIDNNREHYLYRGKNLLLAIYHFLITGKKYYFCRMYSIWVTSRRRSK